MTATAKEISKVMAQLGAKGGGANTAKQTAARKKNAAKARKAKRENGKVAKHSS